MERVEGRTVDDGGLMADEYPFAVGESVDDDCSCVS